MEVIDLLERLLMSARQGNVKTLAIVAVNPIHQVDTAIAGDLSEVRAAVLIGGLSKAAHQLITRS